ncbi:MAG: ANTAR domain-containing protein [Lachnospiraceae bacterium]|nr:ANTAR domain-containing protein [Lachnospiraceae bacterium]
MSKKDDIYHSILIVSSSEQFVLLVKRSLAGFVTIDIRKNAVLARRCILERYYDIVVIDSPLPDENGEEFAIDVTEKSSASVLLVTPRDGFEDSLSTVTDHGVLVVPKPAPRGRIDKAVRYLIAIQDKIHMLETKARRAEEKLEEMRLVNKVKFLLIEKEHMTEDEAHRYIGKLAMDNGISRGSAARSILDEME